MHDIYLETETEELTQEELDVCAYLELDESYEVVVSKSRVAQPLGSIRDYKGKKYIKKDVDGKLVWRPYTEGGKKKKQESTPNAPSGNSKPDTKQKRKISFTDQEKKSLAEFKNKTPKQIKAELSKLISALDEIKGKNREDVLASIIPKLRIFVAGTIIYALSKNKE